MPITEDDVDERAEELFKLERPNDIWAISAKPARLGQDVGASVGFEVREKYRERARIALESESKL